MTRTKVIKFIDGRRVIYSEKHWQLLKELRLKAIEILNIFKKEGIYAIVHGSIARGDVHIGSDIDIVIPYTVPSYLVETILENYEIKPYKKLISQATPIHAIKAHIYLDELTIITFPLTPLSELEREFYKFSGELTLEKLINNERVPGVDKRLMLIIPVNDGHIERSIIGIERKVAKFLNISLEIIEERKGILLRRDEIGRTGVFIKKIVGIDQSFEDVLRKLARENSILRKKLIQSGLL